VQSAKYNVPGGAALVPSISAFLLSCSLSHENLMLSHSSCDRECAHLQGCHTVTLVTAFSDGLCLRACARVHVRACVHMRGQKQCDKCDRRDNEEEYTYIYLHIPMFSAPFPVTPNMNSCHTSIERRTIFCDSTTPGHFCCGEAGPHGGERSTIHVAVHLPDLAEMDRHRAPATTGPNRPGAPALLHCGISGEIDYSRTPWDFGGDRTWQNTSRSEAA
jgi:hypothetical protein